MKKNLSKFYFINKYNDVVSSGNIEYLLFDYRNYPTKLEHKTIYCMEKKLKDGKML